MRIAIGQINPVIGDFAGNVDKILEFSARARELGAELAVFPEMCICGYPPLDLVDQDSFVEAGLQGLRRLQRSCPRGIGVTVGYVDRNRGEAGKPLANAVSLLADGNPGHRPRRCCPATTCSTIPAGSSRPSPAGDPLPRRAAGHRHLRGHVVGGGNARRDALPGGSGEGAAGRGPPSSWPFGFSVLFGQAAHPPELASASARPGCRWST
jgi:hypothetical protein